MYMKRRSLFAFMRESGIAFAVCIRVKYFKISKNTSCDKSKMWLDIPQASVVKIRREKACVTLWQQNEARSEEVQVFAHTDGKTLHEAIMEAINNKVEDHREFVEAFRENVIRIFGNYSADREPTEYGRQIDSLQKQMMTLIEESTRLEDTDEEFDRQYREIEDQIKELK